MVTEISLDGRFGECTGPGSRNGGPAVGSVPREHHTFNMP